MNLETNHSKKTTPVIELDVDDFDFKPITSGLGFHQNKTTEIKPTTIERTQVPVMRDMKPRQESAVYQNDLSLFYGKEMPQMEAPVIKDAPVQKIHKNASKALRFSAYLADLLFLLAFESILLVVMSRAVELDLFALWNEFPHEMTPMAVIFFCGFYLLYFSVLEKAHTSTIGKSMFRLQVVSRDGKSLPMMTLALRTTISLLNFATLGLFSHFDLQNKVVDSKVIRID